MKKSMLLLVLPLLCLTLFPCVSGAIEFDGFGGKVAIVLPEDPWDNAIGFGVIGSLGSIFPQMTALKAEVGAEYWGNSYGALGFDTSLSSISFNGTAKYHFTNVGMSPFAGGGLGLIFTRSSVSWNTKPEYALVTDTSDTHLDLGFHLVGGVDIPIGPGMKFVVEGKYATDGVNTIQLSGGLVVKLK